MSISTKSKARVSHMDDISGSDIEPDSPKQDSPKAKSKKKSKSTKKGKKQSKEKEEASTEIFTVYQHIRLKDKDTGPKEPRAVSLPLYDEDTKKFVWQTRQVSAALITMFDECLVNVSDHHTNHRRKVTDLNVYFDIKTGSVSIKNNGPGIPCYQLWIRQETDTRKILIDKLDDLDEKEVARILKEHPSEVYWNPEVITTHTQSGTNLTKRKDHRTGGTNGIGLKCTVYQSKKFKITTVDENRKIKYVQEFEDQPDLKFMKIHPPTITRYDDPGSDKKWDPKKHAPFTKIEFTPEYTLFGGESYTPDNFGHVVFEYIRMRLYQLRVYTGMHITFMDKDIPITSLVEYAMMHVSAENDEEIDSDSEKSSEVENPKVAHCVMEYTGNAANAEKYKWEVAIIANLSHEDRHVTLVNGIYPYNGGTHISYMMNQLIPGIQDFLRHELGKRSDEMKSINKGGALTKKIWNKIQIFAKCPMDGPSFWGQVKEEITTPMKKFESHKFSHSMVRLTWKVIRPYVLFEWISKNPLLRDKSRATRSGKLDFDGYVSAENAGKKGKSRNTRLFIPEGLSAAQLLDKVLSSEKVEGLTYDNYGYYNIQGVPVNARRTFTIMTNPETGVRTKIGTDKLVDNDRMKPLFEILNLSFFKTYETQEERDTLRYGGVILAVDQDEDGKGNIATLILNFFALFWPALLKEGYVQILRTPIVTFRVPKGKKNIVHEFYTLQEFKEWRDKHPKVRGTEKYHKGLACNSDLEGLRIMQKFEQNLVTFIWDKKSDKNFKKYYGNDASKRKKALSTPVDPELLEQNKLVRTCSEVLQSDTKSFQQYNVARKLPDALDGLLLGRRKIVQAAQDVFPSPNKTMIVNSFGGYVKNEFHYDHGESSLNGSIVKLGQEFVGGMTIPPLLGNSISGFGSRKKGGTDAGAPRYIYTTINPVTNVIFPPADKYLLDLSPSGEPERFKPIVPNAIIQGDIHIPAHGWKVKSFAQDALEVINLTRDCIKGKYSVDDVEELPMFHTSTVNWRGKIVCFRGVLYSVGTYEWDEKKNTITITELPHGVFSHPYVYGDRKKEKRKKESRKNKQAGPTEENKANGTKSRKSTGSRKSTSSRKSTGSHKSDKKKSSKAKYEEEQLKAFRKGVKSKKHGTEYDDIRNDTDSEADDTNDSDNDKDEPQNEDSHKPEYRSRTIKDKPFVADVRDKSSDYQIKIIITLTEDGYKRILAEYDRAQTSNEDDSDNELDDDNKTSNRTIKYGGKSVRLPPGVPVVDKFDPITEYLMLRRSLSPQLNFLDKNKVVKHFDSYEEVFAYWFPERKNLYIQRVERQIILLKYRILELKEILRFSKSSQDNKDEYDIKQKSEEEQYEVLREGKFVKLNTSILHSPKRTSTSELEKMILETNATYDYIINLRFKDTNLASIAANEKALAKLESEYEECINDTAEKNGRFTGANTWLSELDTLEAMLKKGFKHGWGFSRPKDVYDDDDDASGDDDGDGDGDGDDDDTTRDA
jgi:DNA topoisomerase II